MKPNDDIELNAAIELAHEVGNRQMAEWLTELRDLRNTIPPPTIPDDYVDQVAQRIRGNDTADVARAIVLDRFDGEPAVFTDYVMEGGDLLIGSVNDALGTTTPKNPIAAQEWEAYVLDLVETARQFTMDAIDLVKNGRGVK